MIKAIQSDEIKGAAWKLLLIEYDDRGGSVDLFLLINASSKLSDRDYCFDTLEQAKEVCRHEWGTSFESWKPTEPRMTV